MHASTTANSLALPQNFDRLMRVKGRSVVPVAPGSIAGAVSPSYADVRHHLHVRVRPRL
ncbi:hypothetical protein NSPZN2_40379 [Nitrospira defluvii]|uniref:Uncharacterized protein n=1 Tax=Nitrospira defluvii TaxID=330214 RepID=A0ABN7M272_9BACT|nr:hypothetical protein NSPZN2_40379 [Nitrospira defluvii]